MQKSFAVLVLSCDKYADVWPAFFQCFWKNFPAGDWPVYLGSNTINCQEPQVITLLSKDDCDWSTSYKKILEQIPEKKIFVILEDLFPASKVDPDTINSLIDFMFEKDAKYIRYWANPLPDVSTENPLIGECLKGAPYRSTVCGIWDKEYLLSLLLEGENPWNFEILGSYRTSYTNGFYSTYVPLFQFKNLIEKGRWIPSSVEWAQSNNIQLSLQARPILKRTGWLKSFLQMKLFDLILQLPWKYRVNLMNKIRRILISY